jgi:hypothetical protein
VQRLLAQRSQRGRKIPDLLIAAAAEALAVAVLHYDADFDLIASVTGQALSVGRARAMQVGQWESRRPVVLDRQGREGHRPGGRGHEGRPECRAVLVRVTAGELMR